MKKTILNFVFIFMFLLLCISEVNGEEVCKGIEVFIEENIILEQDKPARISIIQTIINNGGYGCTVNNDIHFHKFYGKIQNPTIHDSLGNERKVNTKWFQDENRTEFWIDRYDVKVKRGDFYWTIIKFENPEFTSKLNGTYFIDKLIQHQAYSNQTILRISIKKNFWGKLTDILGIPTIKSVAPFPDQIIEENDGKILVWKMDIPEDKRRGRKITMSYYYKNNYFPIIWDIFLVFLGYFIGILIKVPRKKRDKPESFHKTY